MKQLLLIFIFLFTGFLIFAQEVDNIRAEKDGDKIRIYYNIVNSSKKQYFNVNIKAKIAGEKTIDLIALTGDAGKNIQGGKETYMAEWDVLKDVSKLSSAEFIVIIDLTKDLSEAKVEKPTTQSKGSSPFRYEKSRRVEFFIAAELWGIKTGIRGKLGFALSTGITSGGFTLLADISKSIIIKQNFRWNIYPVFGMHVASWEEQVLAGYNLDEWGNLVPYYSVVNHNLPCFAYGFGTDITIGHIYLNFDAFYDSHSTCFMSGIGWRF